MNTNDTLEKIDRLDESFVRGFVSWVTGSEQKKAWCYLVEPSFAGFGSMSSATALWPEGVVPVWERLEELRLFGELGELHIWKRWGGRWSGRLWQPSQPQENDTFLQRYLLWGTRWDAQCCEAYEERGARVRFPQGLALTHASSLSLSLSVEVLHRVGYGSESHLAGVIDSVWRSVCQKEQPLSPP